MPFIHDDSIVLPNLVQKNLESGRVYMVDDGPDKGAVFPSITRILGAKPKPQLDAWKKKVGAEKAARVSTLATARGHSLHQTAETHLKNQELPEIGLTVAELWGYLRPWMEKHITKVYGIETNVYSVRLGVAGRFDLLCELDGKDLAVVDFKQSNRPKKEAHVAESYYLQGSFYGLALYELTKRKARRVVFPVVSPEGLQVFETTPTANLAELQERISYFYDLAQISLDSGAALPV